MLKLKDVSRKQAILSHLALSFGIFIIVLYFIVFHWYPTPFFTTDGGWQGVRLIAAVDLVLGPVLTFIIFKPGKKGLKSDIIIIAVIQFTALLSGLYVVHNERPVARIFQDGVFHIVTAYDMNTRNISIDDLEKYRFGDAIAIYLDLPDDFIAFEKLQRESAKKQEALFLNTSLYKKIDDKAIKKMRLYSIDIERFIKNFYDEKALKAFYKFINKYNAKVDDFLYIGLHSRYKHAVIVLDPKSLKFIGVVPIIYKPEVDVFHSYIKFDIYRVESYKKYLQEKMERDKKNKTLEQNKTTQTKKIPQ